MGAFDDLIPASKGGWTGVFDDLIPETAVVETVSLGGAGAFDDLIPKERTPQQSEPLSRSVTMGASPEGLLSGRHLSNMPEGYNPGYSLPEGPIRNPDYLPNLPKEGDLPPEPGLGEIAVAAAKSVPYRLGKGAAGVARMAEGQVESSLPEVPKESDYSLSRVQAAETGDLKKYDDTNAQVRTEHELPGEKFFRAAVKRLEEIRPKGLRPGSAKYYAHEGLGTALENIPMLMTGAFTGPSTPLAIMAARVAGDHYGEMRDTGRGHLESMVASVGYGAAEAIGEKTPMGILLDKDLPFLKRLIKSYLPEVGGELVTETLQAAIDKGTIDPEMTWGQFKDRMVDTAIVSSIAHPVLAGAGHASVKGAELIARPPKEEPGGERTSDNLARKEAPDTGAQEPTGALDIADTEKAQAREISKVEAMLAKEKGGFTNELSNTPIAELEKAQKASDSAPKPEQAPDANEPKVVDLANYDRRSELFRKPSSEMTHEETRQALLTSEVTGLPNRRAYNESKRRAVQVAMDLDSFKWVNSAMGHPNADILLKALGDVMLDVSRETNVQFNHISGDEFAGEADTPEEADAAMKLLQERVNNHIFKVNTPDGVVTLRGVGMSYGKGATLKEADFNADEHKKQRAAAGERTRKREDQPKWAEIYTGKGDDVRGVPAPLSRGNEGRASGDYQRQRGNRLQERVTSPPEEEGPEPTGEIKPPTTPKYPSGPPAAPSSRGSTTQAEIQRQRKSRVAITETDSPLSMIRKLGGVRPDSPLIEEFLTAASIDPANKKATGTVLRREGMTVDKMMEAVAQNLPPSTPGLNEYGEFRTKEDFFEFMGNPRMASEEARIEREMAETQRKHWEEQDKLSKEEAKSEREAIKAVERGEVENVPMEVAPGVVFSTRAPEETDPPHIVEARKRSESKLSAHQERKLKRAKLHEQVAEDVYGDGARIKNRRIDIVMGLPGSGKSSVVSNRLIKEHGSLEIDADTVKEHLPEYRKYGGEWAMALHGESAEIAENLILDRALERGDNIVWPLIGKNLGKMRGKIDLLNKIGYEVHLHHVVISKEESIKRVIRRYEKTGRFVDPNYIRDIFAEGNLTPSDVFDILIKEGGLSSYAEWSNEVPKGTPPKLLRISGKTALSASRSGRSAHGHSAKDFRAGVGTSRKGSGQETLDRHLPGAKAKVVKRTQDHADAEALAKAFGLEAVFFETDDPLYSRINGFVPKGETDRIYLNVRAIDPILQVAGHEVIHSLRNNNPQLYAKLAEMARKEIGEEGIEAYRQEVTKRQAGISGGISADTALEEFIADYAGMRILEPEFLNKVKVADKTLYDRIIEALRRILEKIGETLGVEHEAVQRLDRALAETLVEFANRKPTVKEYFESKKTVSEELKFSIATDSNEHKIIRHAGRVGFYQMESKGITTEKEFQKAMKAAFNSVWPELQLRMPAVWEEAQRQRNKYHAAEKRAKVNKQRKIENLVMGQKPGRFSKIDELNRKTATAREAIDSEFGKMILRAEKAQVRGAIKEVERQAMRHQLVAFLQKTLPMHIRGRVEFFSKVQNVKTSKDLEVAKTRALNLLETWKQNQAIKGIKGELRATRPKSVNGRPVGKFSADVQLILDTLAKVMNMTEEGSMAEIEKNLKTLLDSNDGVLPPEVAMMNHALEIMSGLENRPSTELIGLYNDILILKAKGRVGRGLAKMEQAAESERVATQVIHAVSAIDPDKANNMVMGDDGEFQPKTVRGRVSKYLSGVWAGHMNWPDLIERLALYDKADDAKDSSLQESLGVHDTSNAQKAGMEKAIRKVNEAFRRIYGFKKDSDVIRKIMGDNEKVDLGTFVNGKGEKVRLVLTRSQMRKQWMEWKDPALVKTYIQGMGYTEEMFNTVEKKLADQDREWAKWQLDFYQDYYKGVDKVYSDLNGVHLPKNENYTPIKRKGWGGADSEFSFMGDLRSRASVNKGSLKTRVENLNPIVAQGDMDVLQRHIFEMEHYKAWAPKLRLIRSVFAKGAVRETIKKYRGVEEWQHINYFMDDFARNGVDVVNLDQSLERLRQKFVTSVLALKPAIAVKQFISIPALMENVPAHHFAAGIAKFFMHPIRNYKMLLAESPYLRHRYDGGAIERDLRAVVKSDSFSAWRLQRTWINTMMLNIEMGDKAASMTGGFAVYNYNKNVLGKSQAEAIREMEIAVNRTMQSADLHMLSYYQRNPSILTRMFTTFVSQPIQQAQREVLAGQKLLTGKGRATQHIRTLLLYQILLPGIFQLIANFGKWDDEEQIKAAILGPFTGWYLTGQMAEGFLAGLMRERAYGDVMLVAELTKAGRATRKIWDRILGEEFTDEEFYKVGREVAGALGIVTGYPFKSAVDIGAGWSKAAEAEIGSEFQAGLAMGLGFPPSVARRIEE